MKALITGGAGFLGSNLARRLLERGDEVTLIDNLSFGYEKNVIDIEKDATFINADITSPAIKRYFESIDVVFHLAAIADAKFCEENPEEAMRANVDGTANVLQAAYEKKVGRVIFNSSAYVYGNPSYVPIDEKHPLSLLNTYSLTKRIGEEICDYYISKHDLDVMYFRSFNIFGPRQSRTYFIPSLIIQAIEKGSIEIWSEKPTRDYLYISDAVEGFLKAASCSFRGGPINFGYGIEMSSGRIGHMISESLGVEMKSLEKVTPGPTRAFCDNKKAMETLDWKPNVEFDDGLKKTIDWYKNIYYHGHPEK